MTLPAQVTAVARATGADAVAAATRGLIDAVVRAGTAMDDLAYDLVAAVDRISADINALAPDPATRMADILQSARVSPARPVLRGQRIPSHRRWCCIRPRMDPWSDTWPSGCPTKARPAWCTGGSVPCCWITPLDWPTPGPAPPVRPIFAFAIYGRCHCSPNSRSRPGSAAPMGASSAPKAPSASTARSACRPKVCGSSLRAPRISDPDDTDGAHS